MKHSDEFEPFRILVRNASHSKEALWALAEQAKHDGQYECAEIAIAELIKRYAGWYQTRSKKK